MKDNNGFVNLLESIAERSPIKEKEGDYKGPDGLIYCGSCRTPKQVNFEVNGRKLTPFCMCKCEAEKYEKEKAEEKA